MHSLFYSFSDSLLKMDAKHHVQSGVLGTRLPCTCLMEKNACAWEASFIKSYSTIEYVCSVFKYIHVLNSIAYCVIETLWLEAYRNLILQFVMDNDTVLTNSEFELLYREYHCDSACVDTVHNTVHHLCRQQFDWNSLVRKANYN